MKIRKSCLILILLLAFLVWPHSGRAEEAHLSDIVVTNTRDHLLLYFSVNDCFTPELNQAIESGINTSFTFFVELFEKRDLLWDKKIADREISHSIKYDNLKEIYEVRLSEKGNKAVVVKDFDEAKKLMSEVVALEVSSLNRLRKGGHYRIRMMAELDKIKLPFYLHYVLFFLSLWDFETDWYTVDFRY
ncbi:MAG: DUF4390 domain-containing protein [Pseudomonadota bacterium]